MPVFNPGIQGTLTTGRIPFATGTKLLADDSNLVWDNTNKRLGIGVASPGYQIDLLGTGIDVGYVARFKENGTAGSSWIQIASPSSGANGQAGFTLLHTPSGIDWRFAALGDNGEKAWRVTGNGLDVFMCSLNGNVIINNSITDPTTGTKCLIFGDGTAPSGLDSNTAGLYADDVSGTVNMFAINEAGDKTQVSGDFVVAPGRFIFANAAAYLMRTKVTWTNGAGALTGTLTNSPVTGNPTKWIAVDDNGTARYIPAW